MRGAFFKELPLLGRPMSQMLLVDNSPISVACNADNGVLIRSWYGDRQDQELIELLAVLQELRASGQDAGRHLARRYGLQEFFQALREDAGHRH
uniref:Mitochondrial import inner membrane translocase subunit TIM50 n=1 Tax=Strombidinopsis acuminata TaxID=141414 RepID=A0A7S3T7T7_9SPIT